MKKFLLFLCMATCLFASCTEDELTGVNSSLKNNIQAVIEANVSQSRLAVNSDNSLSWMQGDAFEMFTSEGTSSTWTLTNVTNGLGFFAGSVPEGTLSYAFYPSSEENKPVLSGSEVTMTIPHELTYSENATCDLPRFASLNPNVGLDEQTLSFKYLTAMLKINVNEIPEGFHTLKVSASQAIAGNFVVNLSTGEFAVQDEEANQKKEVEVSFNAISGSDNDRAFYLPLVAGNYQSLKVAVSNGSKEIVLKEWSNRSIHARMVYWASLTVKESDTTEPAGVTSELESLTVENPTVTLTLTEPIVASETPIEVPVVEGVKAVATLEFAQTPTTSESTPLIIAEAETTSQPAVEATNEMVLSFPNNSSEKVYLELETPQNTVTVESGNFATIVAATAANTFVVCDGVTIENLIVKAGNVVIQAGGEITGSITRHESNTDVQTFVIVEEEAAKPVLGNGVVLAGGALVADKEWYADDATSFEISTPQQLYGFMKLLEDGKTFEGMTVKMAADIDMFGYTVETSGMMYNTAEYVEFKGTFDGQGYSIKNLDLTYVPSVNNSQSERSNVFVAIIPASNGAVIQNVTIEGGKAELHSVTPDQDSFYFGPLVGYARATNIINCHNVGCAVVLESQGYAGGIIGRVARVSIGSGEYINTHVIACTNSGSVTSKITSTSATNIIGGIAGGGWGSNTYMVACYNTGTITGMCPDGYNYAAGIAADFGGYNYYYACFNDAKVGGLEFSGDLAGQATYSGYYNYSCYTGELFAGQDWTGEANITEIKKVSSYAEAVETLNEGIAVYNALETTTVLCEYRYVAGSVPQLQHQ